MGKWTVDIDGTNFPWKKIHFSKVYPSPDPDTFDIILNDNVTTVTYFDYVAIRRFGVVKFFGYIEGIQVSIDEGGGTITTISGRCRKLIMWKKYMDRYIDTRLEGFFGRVFPHEVFKFLMRCPKSDIPDYDEAQDWERDFPRHKIGWGISSESWVTTATDLAGTKLYAAGTDPMYPRLRLSGFYWRNRGTISNIITRVPDGTAGGMQWNEQDAAGAACINTDDGDATYIWEWVSGDVSYAYTFQNLGGTASGINSVILHVEIKKWAAFPVFGEYRVLLEVYDGTAWYEYGYFQGPNTFYQDHSIDITDLINTVAEFNAMQVRFTLEWNGGIGAQARITYVSAVVDYSTSGTQEVGDKFVIDLGEVKDRVCGIIIQSRYSTDQFARNYDIEYSLDGVGWATLESVVNSTTQDILHSWTPISMRYIRARITVQDLSYAWEITQVYVYQSDDADYTILESTISPNLVLDEDNITVSTILLQPFNMPYQRLTDAGEQVGFAAFSATYVPWEWWIDEAFGEIYFAASRGTDLSATVQFIQDVHIRDSLIKYSINKTAQRIRVIGKGEGRRQDEVTSNWQDNAAAIAAINSFYEELMSEKEISYTETANEWARVWLTKLKDIRQEVKHTITHDPYQLPENDYDVGDTITTQDTRVGIASASRRIKKLDITITSEGEVINITCINKADDISDRLSEIYKRLKKLELSSTGVEEWTAEGSGQNRMTQEKMESYWKMQRKYDDTTEFADLTNEANQTTYWINPAGWLDVNVGEIQVSEEDLVFKGPSANTGGVVNPEVHIGDPATGNATRTIKWKKNPKFMCKVMIVDNFVGNNDYVIFGMDEPAGAGANLNRFGFYIEWDGASYTLKAMMDIEAGGLQTRDFGTITTGVLYELEASVDWDDKMIFYSVGYPTGTKQQGVIPIFDGVDGEVGLAPMWILGYLTGDGVNQAILDYYLWKSQGLKEAESK